MNYQDICIKTCETARRAGEFIAEQRLTFSTEDIELKGHQNLVSYVDKEAEKMIVSELGSIFHQAAILGEEGTTATAVSAKEAAHHDVDDYCWVIDPLDGTTNFVHGMPPYCVSIALMKGQEVVVGVVYEITNAECFYAWKDSEAFLNGKPIHVSQETEIGNSLVITGLAYNVDDVRERFNHLFDFFNRYSHGARRTGSAAANLIYVAAGRAECFYQSNLSPWDVAAGALIVERAGGCVTDYSESDNYIFGREIVASNNIMHQKFIEIVR